MQAIILSGGFGTRLSHIVSDVPKPMASVASRPFLQYIIDDLIQKGVDTIILAVGFKRECIINFFGDEYKSCKILYSHEDSPLLTGGAIKKSLDLCSEKNIFILNGDTFFNVDLKSMLDFHTKNNAKISIAIKNMHDFDRYASVICTNNKITAFNPKQFVKSGYINGGIYILSHDLFKDYNHDTFSFEEKILETLKYPTYAYKSDGYFIDIGIEADYYKANKDFENYLLV